MRIAHAPSLFLIFCALASCTSSTASDTPTGGKGGSIQVTASAEAFGQNGFAFPDKAGDAPFFVDGWSVRFDEILVTFDHITVSEDPNLSLGDQSQVGSIVAEAYGPWAVDLKKAGPLKGKGGDDTSIAITAIENQNLNDGKAFDTASTYAFGYQTVKASPAATKLNFDATNETDYQEMIAKGYVVFYVGTAEFKGTDCVPALGAEPTLDALPRKVSFRLGFTKAATMVNCQNPDLGDSVGGENPRGLTVKSDETTIAQLTLHTDHPFWDSRQEDAPIRFDAFAFVAQSKSASAVPTVTFEDFVGIPFAPIAAGGKTLPARTCSPAESAARGELTYDPKGATFADLHDFVLDRQSTQAHLNADGLCFVK